MSTRPIRILVVGGDPAFRASVGNLLTGSSFFAPKLSDESLVQTKEGKFSAWKTIVYIAPNVDEKNYLHYSQNLKERVTKLTKDIDLVLYLDSVFSGIDRGLFFAALGQSFHATILKNLYIYVKLMGDILLSYDSSFIVQKEKLVDGLRELLAYHVREKGYLNLLDGNASESGESIGGLGVLLGLGLVAFKLFMK